MPISRVMNNPDGSTPVPPVGGGDVNGTLATSILGSQTGTDGSALSMERHQHFQTSSLGIPAAVMLSAGALEQQSEPQETILEAEQDDAGTSEPPGSAARNLISAAVEHEDEPGDVSGKRRRGARHKP